MKWFVGLGILVCIGWAIDSTGSVSKESPVQNPLGAPTYYIATQVYDCEPEPNYVDFRGASNLPVGAVLAANVMNFNTGEDFGQPVSVAVNKAGFFAGKILPKKGMKLGDGLILRVSFDVAGPTQANSVLNVLGKKGQRLAEVERVLLSVPGDIDRPAVNPQLTHRSGEYYGLFTTSMVGNCGQSH